MAASLMKEEDFKGYVDGKECKLATLKNSKGVKAQISNYGARIVSFIVPNKAGEFYDIVIGHDSLENYKNSNERYFNAVIGRYAGRIARGRFEIGGKQYSLSVNNGPNHLHGGFKGLNEQVWRFTEVEENFAALECVLSDGLDGYPGEFRISAAYTLTEDNALMFEVHAQCSKDSIVNITNHAFFNLGDHCKNILGHKLCINAEHYLPLNEDLIPSGRMDKVEGTPFDFRNLKSIGADIKAGNVQLNIGGGYDHSYVCDEYKGRNLFLGAVAENEESGLRLEIYTNQPSVHFYSCNFLNGKDKGKGGVIYKEHGAFCLETQHFPDSPNNKDFPSTLLRAGGEYSSLTVYKVGWL